MKKYDSATWILFIVTTINVLVATGYSIAGILAPHTMLPANTTACDASLIFALYAAARTIPLAVLAIVFIVARNKTSLMPLAILAGCVQFADGFIGIYQHDLMKSAGPFFLAAAQFIAVWLAYKKGRS